MSTLGDSWNAFSPDVASRYLKTYGHPSESSKAMLVDVLRQYTNKSPRPRLIDLGCGNAQLAEYFVQMGFDCDYTGVDFSDALLDAGRRALPTANFIKDDINVLSAVTGNFDIALYSHVVELLSAPEDALSAAKRVASTVVIRFYEPPEFERDSVELRWLDVGSAKLVPYLRRKMSRDYYRLILSRLGCKFVEIYRDVTKDQIHVLHF
jgi:ubiquinone/menaquinone biosynthesis C-methylase UbiE